MFRKTALETLGCFGRRAAGLLELVLTRRQSAGDGWEPGCLPRSTGLVSVQGFRRKKKNPKC